MGWNSNARNITVWFFQNVCVSVSTEKETQPEFASWDFLQCKDKNQNFNSKKIDWFQITVDSFSLS